MDNAIASTGLSPRRHSGQASSLFQALCGTASRAVQALWPWRERIGAEAWRRDVAQVRELADQVRPSQPGYADDLLTAAAALEAQRTRR